MLSPRKHLLVVNLYEELGSLRAVADIVGCDQKTVKAHVVRNAERPPLQRAASPIRSARSSAATWTRPPAGSRPRRCFASCVQRDTRAQRTRCAEPSRWTAPPGGARSSTACTGPGIQRRAMCSWSTGGHVGKVQTAAGVRPVVRVLRRARLGLVPLHLLHDEPEVRIAGWMSSHLLRAPRRGAGAPAVRQPQEGDDELCRRAVGVQRRAGMPRRPLPVLANHRGSSGSLIEGQDRGVGPLREK